MSMDVLKVALVCAAALIPLALLKKHSAEQALLLTAAVMALAVCFCLSYAQRVLRVLEELCERAGIEGEYFAILLRTLAASLVTHLCADLCRDGGSQALAALVEISGAVAALLISLPILEAVTELLLGYFS